MATGTGNLPNPGMSFSPFAILTAEEQNQLVANIESLATGSGIGDGAVTANKLNLQSLRPFRQSFSLSAGTGSKALTGFGFKPSYVEFHSRQSRVNASIKSWGMAIDGTPIQNTFSGSSSISGSWGSAEGTTASLAIANPGGGVLYAAAVTSFDADGITLNVSIDSALYRDWFVIAYK